MNEKLRSPGGKNEESSSSKCWIYHSHVEGDEESNLGLIGLLIVTDPKRARPDGTPADVDRELATLFMIFDESGAGGPQGEAAEYGNAPPVPVAMAVVVAASAWKSWVQMQIHQEQGIPLRHQRPHLLQPQGPGNEPGRARPLVPFSPWDPEQDFHTPHWHGLTVVEEGRRFAPERHRTLARDHESRRHARRATPALGCCTATSPSTCREGMSAQFTIHPTSGPKAPQPFLGQTPTHPAIGEK